MNYINEVMEERPYFYCRYLVVPKLTCFLVGVFEENPDSYSG